MAKKQIEIRIYKDGTIQSETHGIKGRKCMDYMEVLQELLQARITDSEFTPEYLQTDIEVEEIETVMVEEG